MLIFSWPYKCPGLREQAAVSMTPAQPPAWDAPPLWLGPRGQLPPQCDEKSVLSAQPCAFPEHMSDILLAAGVSEQGIKIATRPLVESRPHANPGSRPLVLSMRLRLHKVGSYARRELGDRAEARLQQWLVA